jgi:L-alanine-DL-glutamate epimerase-like enolase superfamily enzyme
LPLGASVAIVLLAILQGVTIEMIITDVRLFQLKAILPRNLPRSTETHATPFDLYPDLREKRRTRTRQEETRALYVEIITDEPGLTGLFGPIQPPQMYVIHQFLKPFLIGRDPLANELLLDQMMRMDRHGRSGIFMTGVSPIDCALWDLKGKAWGQPVYRLLGGPTRSAVPAYASMLGHPVEPSQAAQTAAEFKAKGYNAQKWFFKHGPGEGEEGIEQNIALAQAVREAVGNEYRLMFDAYMSWDVSYAVRVARRLERYEPFWLEEPLPPERVGSFCRLKKETRVPLATGEHVYTRWQVRELLQREAIDFIQTDPDWTGGITELSKICALASSFEVPVVAHGHSLLAALHVAAAQSPATVPMVEYLVLSQPTKQFFHDPVLAPEKGQVVPPDGPGLGIVLAEEHLSSREEVG